MEQGGGGRGSEIFGPFQVYERLGAGGMAVVHRAVRRRDDGRQEVVALKRLLPHLAADAAFIRAFAREARTAQGLRHDNICLIHELGRVGEIHFISMELLEGCDLRALLRRAYLRGGPPPLTASLSLLVQLCAALHHAHNATDPETGELLGLVHRDVSPANVFVTRDGTVKVIDFGIAKATLAALQTETGRFRGKLGYLSPEAIQGQAVDGRSDIFSVGVIAYELMTGKPLFGSLSDYETLSRVQFGKVDPPSAHNSKVPPALDDAIMAALARDPSDRWPSAATMGEAFAAIEPGPSRQALAGWSGQARRERPAAGPLGRAPAGGVAPENPTAQVVDLVWGAGDRSDAALPEVPDLSAAPAPAVPPDQATIQMWALQRRPRGQPAPPPDDGDTIKMEQLLPGSPDVATVKMEPLVAESSTPTDRIASRRRASLWAQRWEQIQLTAAALLLLLSPLGRDEPARAEASSPAAAAIADMPAVTDLVSARPAGSPLRCRLEVTSRPRQALVWIDDEVLGDTPLQAEVDCAGGVLAIEKDHYRTDVRTLSFAGAAAIAVDVSLEKKKPGAKRRNR